MSLLEKRNSCVGVVDGAIVEDGVRLVVLLLTTNRGSLHPLSTILAIKVFVGLTGDILHCGDMRLVYIWNGVILCGLVASWDC